MPRGPHKQQHPPQLPLPGLVSSSSSSSPAAQQTSKSSRRSASNSTKTTHSVHNNSSTAANSYELTSTSTFTSTATHAAPPADSSTVGSSPELISSQPSSRIPSRYTTPLPEAQPLPASAPSRSAPTRGSGLAAPSPENPSDTKHRGRPDRADDEADEIDDEDWLDGQDPAMSPTDPRPPYVRPADSKSYTPLLSNSAHKHEGSYDSATSPDDTGGGRGMAGAGVRPNHIRRRSTLREQDPELDAKRATRKRYIYAAFFLALSLISFTVQTETAVYIQHNLHWNKAYAMLYLTHGSWTSLWFLQLLILRVQKWKMPWETFWRRHRQLLRQTALMVKHQDVHAPETHAHDNPWPWILRTACLIACALTVAGGSWYVAVDWTTASDLTAIYNCSAFFAYAFSVPLLHERLRWSKVLAVAIAIGGVLIVAYGDAKPSKHGSHSGGGAGGPDAPPSDVSAAEASHRSLGNIVIGVGSILYGFYEVLYKKYLCPPDGTSPGRSMIFANLVGSLLGGFTLLVLWIPIPILHILGWEVFRVPTGQAAWLLLISTFSNAIFSGSFLVLISLTSPVLSSVAALLTIFLVALVDQLLPPPLGSPLTVAAGIGGCLIIGAFLVLSWATYIEIGQERRKKAAEGNVEDSSEEEDEEGLGVEEHGVITSTSGAGGAGAGGVASAGAAHGGSYARVGGEEEEEMAEDERAGLVGHGRGYV